MKGMLLLGGIVLSFFLSGCNVEPGKLEEQSEKMELTDEEKLGKEMAIKRMEENLERAIIEGKDESTCMMIIEAIDEKIKLFKTKYNYVVYSPYSGLSYDEAYEYFQLSGSEEIKGEYANAQKRKVQGRADFIVESILQSLAFDNPDTYYPEQEKLLELDESCDYCLSNPYTELNFDEAKEYCLQTETVTSKCTDSNFWTNRYNSNIGSSSESVNSNIDNKNSCVEISGSYTSQGLSVSSCRYSSTDKKIYVTVNNNSGYDLSYLEVEIYGIDSNGKTILSDYTNHGSTIRNGASQTLETYIDYATSYEVEISKATVK